MAKVYLIGAGPGAADLLTLRAARLLARADVVLHDALIPPPILALATRATLVPVGKRCGVRSTAQHFINKRLIDAARCYDVVIRLKGGDPMLFGRAQEEIDALVKADVEVEVVPGVTAALGASAELGVSLTRRALSRSVVFATPRVGQNDAPSRWIESVFAADTAVLYMAWGQAPEIARALIEKGKAANTPVAIVEGASWESQTSNLLTLGRLAVSARVVLDPERPTIMCIGEVFREALENFSRAQFSGKTVRRCSAGNQ